MWAELFLSRFDVPRIGRVGTLAWYVESKYRLGPNWFAAGRFNHQVFDDISVGTTSASWDRETIRLDAALGYRLNRHWQARVQYSYQHKDGPLQQGEQMLAAQLTLRF